MSYVWQSRQDSIIRDSPIGIFDPILIPAMWFSVKWIGVKGEIHVVSHGTLCICN